MTTIHSNIDTRASFTTPEQRLTVLWKELGSEIVEDLHAISQNILNRTPSDETKRMLADVVEKVIILTGKIGRIKNLGFLPSFKSPKSLREGISEENFENLLQDLKTIFREAKLYTLSRNTCPEEGRVLESEFILINCKRCLLQTRGYLEVMHKKADAQKPDYPLIAERIAEVNSTLRAIEKGMQLSVKFTNSPSVRAGQLHLISACAYAKTDKMMHSALELIKSLNLQ